PRGRPAERPPAAASPAAEAPARPRAAWKGVAVPTEHGGWGLTLEPVLLGLLVAWSGPGVALGLAAFVAFVARTPRQVALVGGWRGRRVGRSRLAGRMAAGGLVLLAGLLALAAAWADGPFWIPLALALPLIAVELWFDMRSRSRRLAPELAGSAGIAAVGAAIVLVADGPAGLAAGVWLVLTARAAASLVFVRFQLRRARVGVTARDRWVQDLTQVGALLAVAGAVVAGWLPVAAVVVMALV